MDYPIYKYEVVVSFVNELGIYEAHYFKHRVAAIDFYNSAKIRYDGIVPGFVDFIELKESNEK